VNAYSLFAQESGTVNHADCGKWPWDDGFLAGDFRKMLLPLGLKRAKPIETARSRG
jgi:hypothetical protein